MRDSVAARLTGLVRHGGGTGLGGIVLPIERGCLRQPLIVNETGREREREIIHPVAVHSEGLNIKA